MVGVPTSGGHVCMRGVGGGPTRILVLRGVSPPFLLHLLLLAACVARYIPRSSNQTARHHAHQHPVPHATPSQHPQPPQTKPTLAGSISPYITLPYAGEPEVRGKTSGYAKGIVAFEISANFNTSGGMHLAPQAPVVPKQLTTSFGTNAQA